MQEAVQLKTPRCAAPRNLCFSCRKLGPPSDAAASPAPGWVPRERPRPRARSRSPAPRAAGDPAGRGEARALPPAGGGCPRGPPTARFAPREGVGWEGEAAGEGGGAGLEWGGAPASAGTAGGVWRVPERGDPTRRAAGSTASGWGARGLSASGLLGPPSLRFQITVSVRSSCKHRKP